MTKTIKLISVLFASMLIFGTSCNTYEDGPKLSLRSKKARMANTWKVIEATDADDNVTAAYAGWTWKMTKEGDFTTGGSTASTTPAVQEGDWEFNADKDKLIITYEGVTLPVKWIITRLKNDELWIKREQANGVFATFKFEGQD